MYDFQPLCSDNCVRPVGLAVRMNKVSDNIGWKSVGDKDGLADTDSMRAFCSGDSALLWCAFSDTDFSDAYGRKMNRAFSNDNVKFQLFKEIVAPKLEDEYSRVENIINDARQKDRACCDYLLSLQ